MFTFIIISSDNFLDRNRHIQHAYTQIFTLGHLIKFSLFLAHMAKAK